MKSAHHDTRKIMNIKVCLNISFQMALEIGKKNTLATP